MKILIIGKGGREHAMLEACKKSKLVDKIYVLPGNCMISVAIPIFVFIFFSGYSIN